MKNVLIIIVVLFMCTSSEAGVSFSQRRFSFYDGSGARMKEQTMRMIEGIKRKNKEQARQAWEAIQQILRNLPDTTLNSKLMQEYLEIMAKLRKQQSEASFQEIERVMLTPGAVITGGSSTVTDPKACLMFELDQSKELCLKAIYRRER